MEAIVAVLPVALALVQVDNGGVPELLWQLSLVPHGAEYVGELTGQNWATSCVDLSWNGVSTKCFAVGESSDSFSDHSICWRIIKGSVDWDLGKTRNGFVVDG